MNPKITPIFIDPNRIPFSVLFITLDSTKPITWVLVILFDSPYLSHHIHLEGGEKDSSKGIAHINPEVTCNTNDQE